MHKNRPQPSIRTQGYAVKLAQPGLPLRRLRCQGHPAQVTHPRLHSRGYAAKDTQPRLRPRLHSQPCTANVTQPRLCPRLHIHACIAKVTQSRIRSQGYAAKVTQPRLRPRLHCQDYTSPGDIIQVSKHPLFGVARWSHLRVQGRQVGAQIYYRSIDNQS